jgi:hypothetical protein
MLKNSKIEPLRKSRSCSRRVTSADRFCSRACGRFAGDKSTQSAEPTSNLTSTLPAAFSIAIDAKIRVFQQYPQIAVIPRPCNWRVKSTFNHLAIGFASLFRPTTFNRHRYIAAQVRKEEWLVISRLRMPSPTSRHPSWTFQTPVLRCGCRSAATESRTKRASASGRDCVLRPDHP